jgi:AcrR family transcriptional regulator
MPGTDDPPRPGLRERKKAKTRAAIQEQAMRLFRERGYEATTVEQIAEAAEVSPSTFFRYFPTKEAVVMYDVLDPILIEAFRRQPPGLSPIQALRNGMREVFDALPAEDVEVMWERADLMKAVPELRATMIDEFLRSLQLMAGALGERVGLPADDFGVQTLVAAAAGVMMVGWLGGDDPRTDFIARVDRALDLLEAGLPLGQASPGH